LNELISGKKNKKERRMVKAYYIKDPRICASRIKIMLKKINQ
jgi:hypothetical protein